MRNIIKPFVRYFGQTARTVVTRARWLCIPNAEYNEISEKAARTFSRTKEFLEEIKIISLQLQELRIDCGKSFPFAIRDNASTKNNEILEELSAVTRAFHKSQKFFQPSIQRNTNPKSKVQNKWEAYRNAGVTLKKAGKELSLALTALNEQDELITKQRQRQIYDLPTARRLDATTSRLQESALVFQRHMAEIIRTIIAVAPENSDFADRGRALLDDIAAVPKRMRAKRQPKLPGNSR